MVIPPFFAEDGALILTHVTDGRLLPTELGIRDLADHFEHLCEGSHTVQVPPATYLHRLGHGEDEPVLSRLDKDHQLGRGRRQTLMESDDPTGRRTLGRYQCELKRTKKHRVKIIKRLLLTRPLEPRQRTHGSSFRGLLLLFPCRLLQHHPLRASLTRTRYGRPAVA